MNCAKKTFIRGVFTMLISACITCTAQLFLKLFGVHSSFAFFVLGLFLYACGAILMLIAFQNGEASVLHPVLSVGYIGSLFIGHIFLDEVIGVKKMVGVFLIIVGLILMVCGNRSKGEGKA